VDSFVNHFAVCHQPIELFCAAQPLERGFNNYYSIIQDVYIMENIFEMLMVVCFGLSWPLNIRKAWKARNTKGISLPFYLFIWIGYIFGLLSKFIKLYNNIETPFYVWFFYILNTLMVSVGIMIYFRNRSLEAAHK